MSGDSLYILLDLANRNSDAISINSSIEPQDGSVLNIDNNFKIMATAKGGATATKSINAQITVCGSESLSLSDPAQILIEK